MSRANVTTTLFFRAKASLLTVLFGRTNPVNPSAQVSIKFVQINIVTSQQTMAASGVAVTVLTPNGRRQTVKVSPNTPLLQVKCVYK